MTHTIDLQAINRGLGTLASLMQVPEVRTRVAGFHADFKAASKQIGVMGDYKDVHDNLHQLQFYCYDPIVTQSGRFPGGGHDDAVVDIIKDYEITFVEIVVRLQEVATRATLPPDELTWIQDLVQAKGHLRQAITTLDPVPLKHWRGLVHRVLERYPSSINTRLNAASRSLPMGAIVEAMTAIQDLLGGLDLKRAEVQAFELIVSALAELDRQLTDLVDVHDLWQNVDGDFRAIEATIDRDLEIDWPYLKTNITRLTVDESQDWVQNVRRYGAALDEAVSSNDPVKIRSCFSRYHRVAGERFLHVDAELKDLCGQLRDMGTPLAVVAQIIADGKSQPAPIAEARPTAGASRPGDNRVRLEVQLAEQDRQYKALTDQIAALDQDSGLTLDSEQRLILKQRRDAREDERSAASKKMIEIETHLASLKDR